MNNEIKNIAAVELTEQELDTVAGGLSVALGDVQGYASSATNAFSQKDLAVAQQTYAGPNGSYTSSVSELQKIASSAGQSIAIS